MSDPLMTGWRRNLIMFLAGVGAARIVSFVWQVVT